MRNFCLLASPFLGDSSSESPENSVTLQSSQTNGARAENSRTCELNKARPDRGVQITSHIEFQASSDGNSERPHQELLNGVWVSKANQKSPDLDFGVF